MPARYQLATLLNRTMTNSNNPTALRYHGQASTFITVPLPKFVTIWKREATHSAVQAGERAKGRGAILKFLHRPAPLVREAMIGPRHLALSQMARSRNLWVASYHYEHGLTRTLSDPKLIAAALWFHLVAP